MSRQRKVAAEKENHERWLLTYADLITLLLAFFIVLYAGSNQDLEKFRALAGSLNDAFSPGTGALRGGGGQVLPGGGSILPESGITSTPFFQTLNEDLSAFALNNGIAGKVGVRAEQDDVVISLADNLLFNSAEAKLRPESLFVLDKVASQLKGDGLIRVEGHTDNIPIGTASFASNWELSSARATEVLRYLIERGGVDPKRIHAAAYADTRPVSPNDTPEGRARNRRADIVIVSPTGATPAATPAGR